LLSLLAKPESAGRLGVVVVLVVLVVVLVVLVVVAAVAAVAAVVVACIVIAIEARFNEVSLLVLDPQIHSCWRRQTAAESE
jgi:hypothetical protein